MVFGWYRVTSTENLVSVIVRNVTARNHTVGEEVAKGTIITFMPDVSKTATQDSGRNMTGA